MKSQCRTCKYEFDSHTSVGKKMAKPQKGDYSVCINCGTIGKLDGILDLYPITTIDWMDLEQNDPDTYKRLKKIRELIINTRPIWKDIKK